MKRERRQPTRSEGQVSPFPQQLPIGELIAESDAAVFGEAEDIEYHVVHELRGARIPVIHLEKVQLLLEGCCIGRFAGVSVASIHGPLRTYRSGVEERRHPPGGTYFGARVAILQVGTASSVTRTTCPGLQKEVPHEAPVHTPGNITKEKWKQVDISRSEQVETDLDRLIERRDTERRKTEGEQARAELWQESVRLYNARCGEEERLERLHYHEGQIRRLSITLEALIARHEAEAQKYRQNGHHEKGD